jgi:arylsulfatase A-like enzyme
MPDDTDFVWLSCYGGRTPTPAIDRLAAEGARFDQMYCSASACTPSRYTYLTGQYAGHCTDPHFLAQNPPDEPYNLAWNVVLNGDIPSLGHVLRANGYRTGIAGKWVSGDPSARWTCPSSPPDADLDDPAVDAQLRAYQAALAAEVRTTGGFDVAASIVVSNGEEFPIKALREHHLEWITKGALDFLDGCDCAQPFFLYVTPTAFHGPAHDKSYERDLRYTQGGKQDDLEGLHPPRAEMKARLAARGLP